MNNIYGKNGKTEITETNIEEMCILAEDVMQQLYMRYEGYDGEGNDIFEKHYRKGADFDTEVLPLIRKEREALLDDSNGRLLHDLFRRGDEIGKVRYYTLSDIRPWIEPLLPKALQIFRKGTGCSGDCNYVASSSVPDDYLIAAFSREVRNMMMIFAGQRLGKDDPYYLLLLEVDCCHDMDEWVGIYRDHKELKKAYQELSEWLDRDRQENGGFRSLEIGIYEFEPLQEGEKALSDESYEVAMQNIRRVTSEDFPWYEVGKKF